MCKVANSKLLVVDNLISQTAALRLKKITEIREKADDFVHELNRMREEDKVCILLCCSFLILCSLLLQSSRCCLALPDVSFEQVREMVYADLFFQTKTALQSAIQVRSAFNCSML